ncbi:cytochrome P450 [Nocardia sp. CDC159]|uniref:Cytochrome P450 n=1 Tax=Nocardia pulmonis TaxID=2951408 RepID=A0A9X2E4L6_9NOCA|nr:MULTISPECIES: cytochrome P450 [Nocardia]MCM6774047.1 cytochrome P450 [Nocardia pulmonis]MCM6786934.1 cytochrome P450 [Nocardia sp. CDC159]
MNSPLAPYDAAYLTDPHRVHRDLRDGGVVHRVVLPGGAAAWLVTREADVRRLLTDARLSVDKRTATDGYKGFALPPALDANLLNIDPPDHTRLRRLVSHAFTRHRVGNLAGKVQAETDRLLDRMAGRERVDLLAEFAVPLPLTVIGDLLDIPTDDRMRFRTWTDTLLAPDPAQPQQVKEAVVNMEQFFVDLIADRRADPGDDFVSDLIAVCDAGDRLSEDELVSLVFLIFWAGYENSVHLIGNSILALLDHPEQLAALRAAPGVSAGAIEEFLRYAHPNQFAIRRFPTEDIAIGEVTIPAGDTVLLGVASANRDPRRFDRPDMLDLERKDNPHLTFGHGVHYCLGAPLARLEAGIAIGSLLRRLPEFRLAIPRDQLQPRASFREIGLQSLPVIFASAPE